MARKNWQNEALKAERALKRARHLLAQSDTAHAESYRQPWHEWPGPERDRALLIEKWTHEALSRAEKLRHKKVK